MCLFFTYRSLLKRISKAAFIVGTLLFISEPGSAQDIHFSQFMNSPLNLNPAQTGNFKGSYRFVGNVRRQWSSVTIPYQTFGLSADAKDFRRLKNFGLGTSLYYDHTGDSHFSTLVFNVSSSYRIVLSKKKPEYINIGIQGGITQRRIDYSNLTYDQQYNGYYYDPSLPVEQSFANSGRIYPNIHTGILYTKYFEKRKMITGGVALYNITKPAQSFFNESSISLDRRWSFNLGGQHPLGDKTDLLPAVHYMTQGTFKSFIAGTSIKYTLQDNKLTYRAIYAGGWFRYGDAAFISIGMDYDEWFVGLSYDINTSNLKPASNYRGGFELAVIYIVPQYLPKRLKYKVCPDFM
jgi:type IX secretion system PorP/SprF family membrane protein